MKTHTVINMTAWALAAFVPLGLCNAKAGAQNTQSGSNSTVQRSISADDSAASQPVSISHKSPPLVFLGWTESGKVGKAAEALYDQGKFDESLQMCRTAMQLYEKEGEKASIDLYGLKRTTGFCLVEMGKDSEPQQWLLNNYKSGGAVSFYTSIVLARNGDVTGAAKLIKDFRYDYSPEPIAKLWHEALQSESESEVVIEAWHYLGEDALMHSNDKLASAYFRLARALDSHSTLVAYDLGRAYKGLKQFKEAAAEFAWASKSNKIALREAAKRELDQVTALMKQEVAARIH